jgi:lipopolysaccharide export system permease protein
VLIFQRSLTREFTSVSLAVVGVLSPIMVIQTLIAQLRRVASGTVEAEAVLAILGFLFIAYLPVVLALALFISVLVTLSRSYRDSEMAVWFSSGLSITAWVSPVLRFGLPIVATTAVLSLVFTPWALSSISEYQRILRSKDEVSRLSPGMFIESSGADRVVFIDKTSALDGTIENPFMHYNRDGRVGVIVAEKGYQRVEKNGDKFVVLENGRQYEGTPGGLDFRIVDFERMMQRIEVREASANAPRAKELSTMTLLASPTEENVAELHWRIALPLAALILSLMAIPLSFVNPRSGTSLNIILAIVIFFLYYNLLNILQAKTADGRIPMWVGLMPVHLAMAGLMAILFSRQLFSFRWLMNAKR